MDALLAAALPFAEQVGEAVENPSTPAWAIGLAAFGGLVVLLIVTLFISVDRKGPF